jgi:hypothetical protein
MVKLADTGSGCPPKTTKGKNMSLAVWLKRPGAKQGAGSGIFIRENGRTREITRAEWDALNPDRKPVVVNADESEEVYSANITHNLGKMADAAGVYQALWRPEELGATQARQLIDHLTRGLDHLRADPGHFKTFNPENGWGDYDGLVDFVLEYLIACLRYPDAEIGISR